jgi:lipoate-protein ligase A
MYQGIAVVLGRGQRADEGMEARARSAGVDLLARPTGGGAVLAGPWLLGASIVLPPGHPLAPPDLRASYRWLGSAHLRWLAAGGLGGALVDRPVDVGLGWACYGGLSYGEVERDGRKLVGLSQARRKHGVLFSSGALLQPQPWELLCDVLAQSYAAAIALRAHTASWEELGGRPATDEGHAAELLAEIGTAVG